MRYLSIAEFFVNIGRAILLLTFAKFLYDETGQLWAFSLIFTIQMILSFIIPLLAGSAIDHSGTKNVIRITGLISSIICLISAIIVNQYGISIYTLLISSIFLSICNPIIRLSVFSLTPELSKASNLEQHNGSLIFSLQSGQLLGMVSAAYLLKFQSLQFIFISVFFTYFIAFIFYSIATSKVYYQVNAYTKSNITIDTYDGDSISKILGQSRRFLPTLLMSSLDHTLVAIFNVLLAALVFTNYDNNPLWLSILDASFAIGGLIGGVIIFKKLRKSKTNILDSFRTHLIFCVCLILYLFSDLKYLTPIGIITFSLTLSFGNVYWDTFLQNEFPPKLKGRLAGLRNLITSLYIGIITMLISSFHQISYEIAIYGALFIALSHTIGILSYRQRLLSAPATSISVRT